MSMRSQAGIVLPGYNALKVANAPTIGTATNAGSTSVSVAFTAPACVGGGAISSYKAYCTTTGTNIATGASSPLVVTGLTTGQAYTFRVSATNAYGPSYPSAASNSATPAIIQGQQAYTSAGTYSWVAPTGITSVAVVAVGGGAGAGGGGALAYKNNITVVPGNSYSVIVGAGGTGNPSAGTGGGSGGASSFTAGFGTMTAGGATGNACGGSSPGGARSGVYDGGGNGGNANAAGYNGGGAGGYSGNGGNAPVGGGCVVGSGGAGAAGNWAYNGGGGVGILGQGASGTSGSQGGSGGTNGTTPGPGLYGGGSGGNSPGTPGGRGAVRIIWPGTTRSFPSTNTGDL